VLYAAENRILRLRGIEAAEEISRQTSPSALDYLGKEEKLTYVSYYDTLDRIAQSTTVSSDRLAQALHSVAGRTAASLRS